MFFCFVRCLVIIMGIFLVLLEIVSWGSFFELLGVITKGRFRLKRVLVLMFNNLVFIIYVFVVWD